MSPTAVKSIRYAQRFDALKGAGQKALIPFTLLGWPDKAACLETVRAMIAGGASALELGIPFSDPVADGPLIQTAGQEALANGFKLEDAFELLKTLRQLDGEIPIGLLVYYNLIVNAGAEAFFKRLADCGVDGVLIPDLPPELAQEVKPAADAHGIHLIFIVSPLTDPRRLEVIRQVGGGFLYVVSRLGITGVESRYDTSLQETLRRIHQHTGLPACVGFGISEPDHVRQMISQGADGVIVGSRIIQWCNQARQTQQPVSTLLTPYLHDMGKACAASGSL